MRDHGTVKNYKYLIRFGLGVVFFVETVLIRYLIANRPGLALDIQINNLYAGCMLLGFLLTFYPRLKIAQLDVLILLVSCGLTAQNAFVNYQQGFIIFFFVRHIVIIQFIFLIIRRERYLNLFTIWLILTIIPAVYLAEIIVIGKPTMVCMAYLLIATLNYIGSRARMRHQQQIEEKEETLYTFKLALEGSQDAILILNGSGNIEYANKQFGKLTNHNIQDVLSRNPNEIFLLTKEEDVFKQPLQETDGQVEIQVKGRDGQKRILSLKLSALRGKQDQNSGMMAVIEDITEKKETEEKLYLLSLVASKTNNAVVISRQDGKIEWVNEGFSNMTGYTLKEVQGRDPRELLHGPLTDQETVNRVFEHLAAKRSFSEEIINYRKDKTAHWVEVHSTPVKNNAGEVERYFAIVNDISSKKETENYLKRAKYEAERNALMKDEFLANMSHEIRTPLNGVIGMTSLLAGTELSQEQQEFIEIIRTSGESLLTIVNDILDFSKFEAGKVILENKAFELIPLVENLLDTYTRDAKEKGLKLTGLVEDPVPEIIISDPERLRQVLINIIKNSIKFTEEGQILLKVSLKEKKQDQCILLFSLKDTGIGIPKDKINGLFSSFSQVDTSATRKYGGTGLGLTICKNLIEGFGGKIWLESEEGKGTTTYFTLPTKWKNKEPKRISHLGNRKQTKHFTAIQSFTEKPAISILLVEDNLINQKVAKRILHKLGFQADVAENGKEGVSLAAIKHYDLIFMDMQMPVMDGIQATKIIREEFEKQPIIVALTANAMEDDRKKCMDAGMNDFVIKPIKVSDVKHILATWFPKKAIVG